MREPCGTFGEIGILDECFREVDARLTQKKLGIFYDVLERVDNGIAELL